VMEKEDPYVHVDDFIDWPLGTDAERYAKFFFAMFRWPASFKSTVATHMAPFKLFCNWGGTPGKQARFRVTGCSRLGDVWLANDFSQDTGYDHRVSIDECSNWGAEP
jgi:hypothetical protein